MDTFSLQVFPDKKFINNLQKIQSDFESYINAEKINYIPDVDNNLKAYPVNNPCRLALNILRFIGKEEINEALSEKVRGAIGNINIKCEDSVIGNFKISKLALVESDPFLFKRKIIKEINLQ